MESVLSQQAEVEYIVMDGGSTDGSREIIASYSDRLAYWQSEKDGGQYNAINQGFARSTGEIMGWLNSSDLYLPWTFSTVEQIFEKYPDIDWITSSMKTCILENGSYDSIFYSAGFNARGFYLGRFGGPGNRNYIQQESCFWRRSLWEKIGGSIDAAYSSAGDYWLWSRFFKETNVVNVEAPLAAFRFHTEAKSANNKYDKDILSIHADLQQHPKEKLPRGSKYLFRKWNIRSGFPYGYWKYYSDTGYFLEARFYTTFFIDFLKSPTVSLLGRIIRFLKPDYFRD